MYILCISPYIFLSFHPVGFHFSALIPANTDPSCAAALHRATGSVPSRALETSPVQTHKVT